MARGRMISKAISLDEKVDALSDDTARLLFTWMIPHLDCEGRMYGDARIFKSIVAPRRNYTLLKVEKCLAEMEKLGLIERYFIESVPTASASYPLDVKRQPSKNCYLFAPHFEKHQTGLQKTREAQSQIPPPNSRVTPELLQSKDGLTHLQVKEKFKLKRREEEVEEEATTELDFEDYKEELRSEFKDVNFDNEVKKFHLYWSEGGRKLKRPKLALRNWMEKAREIKGKWRKGEVKHIDSPVGFIKVGQDDLPVMGAQEGSQYYINGQGGKVAVHFDNKTRKYVKEAV